MLHGRARGATIAQLAVAPLIELLIASCVPAQGLEPRFVAVHNALTAMGMAQTGSIHEGSLTEGSAANVMVELQAGSCYTFMGLASAGVQNLDILVFDEDGEELGRDTTLDAQAAAHVCAERAGAHRVTVRMAAGEGDYMLSSWRGVGDARPSVEVASAGGTGTCAAPLPAPIGRPVTGDTREGSSNMQASCVRGEAPELVYAIEVTQRTQISATLQSEFDGALYLLRECGDMGSAVACNDDAESDERSRSQIDVAAVDPGTYYLVVDGYTHEAGPFELIVSLAPLRSIDEVCADAGPLLPGQPATGTTAGAPDYFQATCAEGARSPDRVYKLDVPGRQRVRVSSQTNHDGALYVRSRCESATSELVCNDDFARDRNRSVVTALLDPGRYYVYMDGFGGSDKSNSGSYSLLAELESSSGQGIDGDSCRDARAVIVDQDMEVDTFAAKDDGAGSCGGTGAPDAAYKIVVRGRSRLRARVTDAEFEGAMYLRSGCDDSAQELACLTTASAATRNPPQSQRPGPTPSLEAELTPGTYYLFVDGKGPQSFGRATLNVEVRELAALERSCRSAPLLKSGEEVSGSTAGRGNSFQASCANKAESDDVVYRLRMRRRGKVEITMSSEFDGALHLRRSCTDPGTEVACNDDFGGNSKQSQVSAVLEPGLYYVIVDGFDRGRAGAYSLRAEVSGP